MCDCFDHLIPLRLIYFWFHGRKNRLLAGAVQENSGGIKEGTKRERSKVACDLPDNITQDMIPKYVYYVKSRDNHGEHFVIDRKHPYCDKDIKGTKSIKKTAIQKLE